MRIAIYSPLAVEQRRQRRARHHRRAHFRLAVSRALLVAGLSLAYLLYLAILSARD